MSPLTADTTIMSDSATTTSTARRRRGSVTTTPAGTVSVMTPPNSTFVELNYDDRARRASTVRAGAAGLGKDGCVATTGSDSGTASTGAPRRPGRPTAGSPDRREAVLAAARVQFSELGYERTTVRGVAQAAGVDSRLVTHYFGSKQRLFLAVVELPVEPRDILPGLIGGSDDPPHAVAGFLAALLDSPDYRQVSTGLLRAAASEPEAADAARALLSERLLLPLAEAIGADQAPLRASLLASQIAGLVLARFVLELEPVASLHGEDLARILEPVVRHYLLDPL